MLSMVPTWQELAPRYRGLARQPLTAATVDVFLREWTALTDAVADPVSRQCDFLIDLWPRLEEAEQQLRQKFLASGLVPEGFEVPLRAMRSEASLFRSANLPLFAWELELRKAYSQRLSTQTVNWQGEDVSLRALRMVYEEPSRRRREQAWRAESECRLAAAPAFNDLWRQLIEVRRQQAEIAGFPSYREYQWRRLLRFDYTAEDCLRFHTAIEEWVTPVIVRLHEERLHRLGVRRLRPWDLLVDPSGRPPLRPVGNAGEREQQARAVIYALDQTLGESMDTMTRAGVLDLTGGPEVAAATSDEWDVLALFRRFGSAFQRFMTVKLPYRQQRVPTAEFVAMAALTMELLAGAHLDTEGGFYHGEDAVRARRDQLERVLLRWPLLAMMDAFEHWAYDHPEAGNDPAAAEQWRSLWLRFLPSVDWSGLEEELGTAWHGHRSLFHCPFDAAAGALGQLGAVQIWADSHRRPHETLARYRHALTLGNTAPLPALYTEAGATFALDDHTLREAVAAIEEELLVLVPGS